MPSPMSLRIAANLSTIQSAKSAIFLSIRLDALKSSDDLAAAFFANLRRLL